MSTTTQSGELTLIATRLAIAERRRAKAPTDSAAAKPADPANWTFAIERDQNDILTGIVATSDAGDGWRFEVHRDADRLIDTISGEPQL